MQFLIFVLGAHEAMLWLERMCKDEEIHLCCTQTLMYTIEQSLPGLMSVLCNGQHLNAYFCYCIQ
jgi:hypothetical protein